MPVVDQERARVVAQLVNCLGIGGTERQLLESLRRLDSSQWTPDLLCLQKTGELLEDLKALAIDPEEFHLRGSLMNANTARQVVRMARRLRAKKAVLVHSHDFYSNVLSPLAARLSGIPSLISRRDLGAWIGPFRARVLAAMTRQADHVLCNAWAIRDHLVDVEKIDSARITVVPNGLDIARFDRAFATLPQPALPPLTNGWNVALVANMKHRLKGHEDFLLAAADVLEQVPNARFVLVGDGALRASLESQARALGIAHRTLFTGRRNDVPAILSRCQAAVCPSWSEGLSNAVMEAMAARLPVVATAVGGNVELVRDGRSGFLVPKRAPQSLSAKLVELARSAQLSARMGDVGRRRIETEFNADRLGERINALYAQLVGNRGRVQRAA